MAGYYLGQRTGDDKPRFNGACSQDYLTIALIDRGGVGFVHLVSAQGVLFFFPTSLHLGSAAIHRLPGVRHRLAWCTGIVHTGWLDWIYPHIAFCIRMFCWQAQSSQYMLKSEKQ